MKEKLGSTTLTIYAFPSIDGTTIFAALGNIVGTWKWHFFFVVVITAVNVVTFVMILARGRVVSKSQKRKWLLAVLIGGERRNRMVSKNMSNEHLLLMGVAPFHYSP